MGLLAAAVKKAALKRPAAADMLKRPSTAVVLKRPDSGRDKGEQDEQSGRTNRNKLLFLERNKQQLPGSLIALRDGASQADTRDVVNSVVKKMRRGIGHSI